MAKAKQPKLRRASYWRAVNWIAAEDEPNDLDVQTVAELISVVLIAEIFGASSARVAQDVVGLRESALAGGPRSRRV